MNRNELWKTVRLTRFQKCTIAICFNLLQVCPSMPSFLFSVLFIHAPSFDVLQLSGYFHVWLNLVALPTVKILIKVVTLLCWCCGGKNVLLTLSSQFHNNYDHFLFYRLLIQYLRWQPLFHFLYQMENPFLHSHFHPPLRVGKQIHHQLKWWVIFFLNDFLCYLFDCSPKTREKPFPAIFCLVHKN